MGEIKIVPVFRLDNDWTHAESTIKEYLDLGWNVLQVLKGDIQTELIFILSKTDEPKVQAIFD